MHAHRFHLRSRQQLGQIVTVDPKIGGEEAETAHHMAFYATAVPFLGHDRLLRELKFVLYYFARREFSARLPKTVCPPDSKSRDGLLLPYDGFRHRYEEYRYPPQYHRALQGRGYGDSQP